MDGVEVQLADIGRSGAAFPNTPLVETTGVSQPFSLSPGQVRHFEVVHHDSLGDYPDQLGLGYAIRVPNLVPIERYVLTVRVTARDVPPVERRFLVDGIRPYRKDPVRSPRASDRG
jgi:hypothetical protein